MTQKIVPLAGLSAPLLYLATVVIGGLVTPGYSHLHQPVSALFETGAPYATPVSLGFVGYNILLAAFGIGLMQGWRRESPILRVAAAAVIANALLGLVIELTPMDPPGAAMTPAGTAHLVIAGLLVLTCTLAMVTAAIGCRRSRPAAARNTALATVFMLVTGAAAAMAAGQGWPLLGLMQRLTIGTYLVWIFVVALDQRRSRRV